MDAQSKQECGHCGRDTPSRVFANGIERCAGCGFLRSEASPRQPPPISTVDQPRKSLEQIAKEDNEYAARVARVKRGELCYYCMKAPPTKTALHAADGAHLPACDECFAVQVQLMGVRSKTSTGCLLVALTIVALVYTQCIR